MKKSDSEKREEALLAGRHPILSKKRATKFRNHLKMNGLNWGYIFK